MKRILSLFAIGLMCAGGTFAQADRIQLGDPSAQYWLWVDEKGDVQKDDDALTRVVPKKTYSIPFFSDEVKPEKKEKSSSHGGSISTSHAKTFVSQEKIPSSISKNRKNSLAPERGTLDEIDHKTVLDIIDSQEYEEEVVFTRGITAGAK